MVKTDERTRSDGEEELRKKTRDKIKPTHKFVRYAVRLVNLWPSMCDGKIYAIQICMERSKKQKRAEKKW